jgi:hypothetical protein
LAAACAHPRPVAGSYEEAAALFAAVDRAPMVSLIRTSTPPEGCLAVLRALLFRQPVLRPQALEEEREVLLCAGKTAFGQGR